jgi:putative peptidoglycan lipid II flippase
MGQTERNVTRRAGIVGLGTLASRILGLVRESVIVAFFPKAVIDAYQVAFMIPNSFRRLTAEGAFSISVVSVFSKIWSGGDLRASQSFVRAVLGFALIFLGLLTLAGVFGAQGLTWAATLGQSGDPQKIKLVFNLTRLMFPYVFFVSLMALAMGLLNSAGRFFAPAFAPVLLNVSIIGCAVGLSGVMPEFGLNPVYALAIGVLIGGVAQVVFQLPSLKKMKLLVRPSCELKHPGLKQVLKMTGPMIFGAAAYQVGIFITNGLAYSIGDGSVMYVQLANRLIELPLAVLVMAISVAALPSMAAQRGAGELDAMKSTWGHSLRLALFVATPAMVGMIVLAEPLVVMLYQRRLFTYTETVATAAGLRWLALGICSIAVVRQTVQVYYAMEQTRIPVLMTLVFIVTNVVAAVLLMKPFAHVGLCMALSIAAAVQALGLVIVLRQRLGSLGLTKTVLSWIKSLLATIPMAAAVHGASWLGRWEDGGNSIRNLGILGLAVVVGVVVYGLAAYLLRIDEFKELLGALARRRRRS